LDAENRLDTQKPKEMEYKGNRSSELAGEANHCWWFQSLHAVYEVCAPCHVCRFHCCCRFGGCSQSTRRRWCKQLASEGHC